MYDVCMCITCRTNKHDNPCLYTFFLWKEEGTVLSRWTFYWTALVQVRHDFCPTKPCHDHSAPCSNVAWNDHLHRSTFHLHHLGYIPFLSPTWGQQKHLTITQTEAFQPVVKFQQFVFYYIYIYKHAYLYIFINTYTHNLIKSQASVVNRRVYTYKYVSI